MLSQCQGPKFLFFPIAFFSRKLSAPERNYDVGDQELLAIKAALEEWRYLLEGAAHSILLYTDHKNLEYLRTAKCLKPRQARWALFFSRFSFHVTYRPGSKNTKPDDLSVCSAILEQLPPQTPSYLWKIFFWYRKIYLPRSNRLLSIFLARWKQSCWQKMVYCSVMITFSYPRVSGSPYSNFVMTMP